MTYGDFRDKFIAHGINGAYQIHAVVISPDDNNQIFPMHFDSLHVDHDSKLVVVRLKPETK